MPAFRAGLTVQVLFWCQQAACYLLLALFLQQGRGLSPLASGGVFAVLAAGYLVTSLRAPALTMRFGRRVIATGAVVGAAGYLLVLLAVARWGTGGPLDALFPGLFLVGAGQGLCITPLTTTVLAHASPRTAGSVSGALSTAQQVGNAIGVAVSGVVFYGLLGHGYRAAFGSSVARAGRPAARGGGARAEPASPVDRRDGRDRRDRRDRRKADTQTMAPLLTIGEFSRMTHLSVKALRHYHDMGVLEPAAIDPFTGYRSYDATQVVPAQVIRRLRDLGMPLDSIRSVLIAPDLETRNREIAAHLGQMERQLAQTQASVAGLRALLAGPAVRPADRVPQDPGGHGAGGRPGGVRRRPRDVGERRARCPLGRAGEARRGAGRGVGAVRRAVPRRLLRTGAQRDHGVRPCRAPRRRCSGRWRGCSTGQVRLLEIPAVEAAIAVHEGPLDDIDRTYGALGTVVAERAIGVEGPIREYYLIGFPETEDESKHRTEVAWPVFLTG